jgi:hypothetical protein
MIHVWRGAAFLGICYFHKIVMISVIKLCRVVDLADLHGVNVFSDYSWFLSL